MLLSKLAEKLAARKARAYKYDPQKRMRMVNTLQKFIPIVSFLLFFIAIAWLLLLPYDGYSKRTYISENALLPGQVNLEYGYNDVRTAEDFRQKLIHIQGLDSETRANFIQQEFRKSGFVSAVQHFVVDGKEPKTGVNTFAINRAPRSDGKEALILSASWKSRTGEFNTNGIALLLSLAKLFKRNVYWAKDVILLIADEGIHGTQAWLDAYHGTVQNDEFSSIVMPRSGAVQGVVHLDFPGTQDYETLGIFFGINYYFIQTEGVNGQLPNLDLVNTMIAIAGRTGPPMRVTLHDTAKHPFESHQYGPYLGSLYHLLQSMKYLVLGKPSSEAGLYLRYAIDAVTIHGIVGSEHLHQLFGFNRIGNQYMPPVALFACALIFQSLSLYYLGTKKQTLDNLSAGTSTDATASKIAGMVPPAYSLKKRHIRFPFTIMIIVHMAGLVIFNILQPSFGWNYLGHLKENEAVEVQYGISVAVFIITIVSCILWINKSQSPEHDGTILKSFCLAYSALVIATVSLLNFTLGVATAILILIPYSLAQPSFGASSIYKAAQTAVLLLLSPVGLAQIFSWVTHMSLTDILSSILSDYHVVGAWFLTFLCTVYWPMNMAVIILVYTKASS
ncbi:Gaa1-like protein [Mycotypha africana]|uniref:Gaa1-like protein n=1 Tax=Mycotypha africana TaxID=64632 RepID=UPI0023010BA2|nr:Gaa1-like protein [Mycotypha africana]KAI8969002.1 Gaa1-like protein [Mycotypha africana]